MISDKVRQIQASCVNSQHNILDQRDYRYMVSFFGTDVPTQYHHVRQARDTRPYDTQIKRSPIYTETQWLD